MVDNYCKIATKNNIVSQVREQSEVTQFLANFLTK